MFKRWLRKLTRALGLVDEVQLKNILDLREGRMRSEIRESECPLSERLSDLSEEVCDLGDNINSVFEVSLENGEELDRLEDHIHDLQNELRKIRNVLTDGLAHSTPVDDAIPCTIRLVEKPKLKKTSKKGTKK